MLTDFSSLIVNMLVNHLYASALQCFLKRINSIFKLLTTLNYTKHVLLHFYTLIVEVFKFEYIRFRRM